MAQYLVYLPKSTPAHPADGKMGVIIADAASEAAAKTAAAPYLPAAQASQLEAQLLDGSQLNPDGSVMNIVIEGKCLFKGELDRSGGAV